MKKGIEYIKQTTQLTPLEKNNAIHCIQNNQCMRCFSKDCVLEPCLICEQLCLTCQNCRQFGRSCSCCSLVNVAKEIITSLTVQCCWIGKLSKQQQEGSNYIRQSIEQQEDLLVCAVTGSGKTEMVFSGIEYALQCGKRVCIAAPRIDVILELEPRLKQAFPMVNIVTMYGSQPIPYEFSQLVLCTTHQLLKFKKAFSVLIIDEVDSYPLNNNYTLLNRIPLTVTTEHSIIYMSATPPNYLLKQVKNVFELPARYHRFALPIPKCCWIGNWEKSIIAQKMPKSLQKLIKQQLKNNRRFLLFLPNIALMHKLEQLLKKFVPNTVEFTSVYANDCNRVEKIQCMRQQKYHFLLTTTILERGVTFSNIDVIVVGSEHRSFTTATLVQIAGRVGRHKDFPIGDVIFAHYGQTKEMKQAIQFIKRQNQQAREKGYIDT